MFREVSQLLQHVHHEERFDDFARQPLLPNKLSQLGPGVCWFDVDADGREDLVVASGRGGKLGVFRNDGQGGFVPMLEPPLTAPVTRDQTAVLGWRKGDGHTVLLAGSSNYEDGLAVGASVRQFDLKHHVLDDSLPGHTSSTGPVALADLDADGDLDLFVGGRVVPGRYPEPAVSRLFRNDSGTFRLDEGKSKVLANVGLVSGAVFSDLDGDGYAELVLACEWGPLRVFRNDHGRLKEWDPPLVLHAPAALNAPPSTLSQLTGWWNGVTTADFDGDGRMDIVASNWGRNTVYETHRAQPLRLYYGDINGFGLVDLVEAYFEPAMGKIVPERAFTSMREAFPFLRERFATHRAYGHAGVEEAFGERLAKARLLTVNTLESMVFLNRGSRFEGEPLPIEAQLAPAFGVCAADFDGDGHEDLFLAQNFFATQPLTSPYDAGRGLWLRGNGKGEFIALLGRESGIEVYGEQRGCACADYDADGRLDLVVTQNGAATKLYHNDTARPGLRVRVRGSTGNPTGVGAVVRLGQAGQFGPAREIHAGSGYCSQDGAVQVMGTGALARTQLWVRWPGGRVTECALPAGATEVLVDSAGQLAVIRRPGSEP